MTTATYSPTEHEERARSHKATAIACLLNRLEVDPDTAEALDEDGRAYAARLAKVNVPSERTWRLVVDMLRRLAAVADDDPFAGLGQ